MSPTSLQAGTGLVKSRFIKSGLAGASSSGIVVLFLGFGAIPRMPSSFMHFLARYSVVPANSSGRNASANGAVRFQPHALHLGPQPGPRVVRLALGQPAVEARPRHLQHSRHHLHEVAVL